MVATGAKQASLAKNGYAGTGIMEIGVALIGISRMYVLASQPNAGEYMAVTVSDSEFLAQIGIADICVRFRTSRWN